MSFVLPDGNSEHAECSLRGEVRRPLGRTRLERELPRAVVPRHPDPGAAPLEVLLGDAVVRVERVLAVGTRTRNVRFVATFVAPLGAPGSSVSCLARSFHVIRVQVPRACEVLLADAVVFVQRELAVGAGVDLERRRLGHRLRGVLPHRIERNDRAGADVDRHRGEIDLTRHGLAARRLLVRPPVVPVALRADRRRATSRPS